jgi:hypothetical protein
MIRVMITSRGTSTPPNPREYSYMYVTLGPKDLAARCGEVVAIGLPLTPVEGLELKECVGASRFQGDVDRCAEQSTIPDDNLAS